MSLRRYSYLLLALAFTGCDSAPTVSSAGARRLAAGPHLLLDGYLVDTSQGVRRRVNPPARDPAIPNPVVTGAGDDNYTPFLSVLRENDRFRLWYNVPVARGVDRSRLAYMESHDGISWERPHRVLEDPENGIRFGASVIRRPEGGFLFGYHSQGGLSLATSPDGFDWTVVSQDEVIKQNHDIAGVAYDPIRRRYLGIVSMLREFGRNRAHTRMTQVSVSDDLLNWPSPTDALVPDHRDAGATEFYGLDGIIARGEMLVGMAKILRDDLDADSGTAAVFRRGMGYTSLVWSRDGRNWMRDRAVFFGPDPRIDAWDHAFSWVDEQVPVGDEVYLYYGGYGQGHKGDKYIDRQIGLVKMKRDRYVAWEAGPSGGVVRTHLMEIEGSRLTLNVDAGGGEVRVRVLDAGGGAPLGECQPIRGDHLDAPLVCERSLAKASAPIRLEIALRDARLYAWTVIE